MATARKLPSGNWRVRVYTGTSEKGKKRYISFTADTKKKAELLALQHISTNAERLTFGNAAERYISAKSSTLSPNTIRGYKTINNRLSPIHPISLDRMTNERIQHIINDLSKTSSPKTVRNSYGFITAVFKMFEPSIRFNVTLPERIRNNKQIPSEDDIIRMISLADDDDLKLAIQLAAFGSLREGEICALQKDCVTSRGIYIKRNMVHDIDGKSWIIKNSPKTVAGFREIPLPEAILGLLNERINKNEGFAVAMTPSGLYKRYKRYLKRNDFPPYTFHSLRHFFATNLHAQGIPDKYIAKLGGWDDVGTLQRIYQHTTDEKMLEVAKMLNENYQSMTRNMTRN